MRGSEAHLSSAYHKGQLTLLLYLTPHIFRCIYRLPCVRTLALHPPTLKILCRATFLLLQSSMCMLLFSPEVFPFLHHLVTPVAAQKLQDEEEKVNDIKVEHDAGNNGLFRAKPLRQQPCVVHNKRGEQESAK